MLSDESLSREYNVKRLTLKQKARVSLKKKKNKKKITFSADISISEVSSFACTLERSLSVGAHSIGTTCMCSFSTLIDVWKKISKYIYLFMHAESSVAVKILQ